MTKIKCLQESYAKAPTTETLNWRLEEEKEILFTKNPDHDAHIRSYLHRRDEKGSRSKELFYAPGEDSVSTGSLKKTSRVPLKMIEEEKSRMNW